MSPSVRVTRLQKLGLYDILVNDREKMETPNDIEGLMISTVATLSMSRNIVSTSFPFQKLPSRLCFFFLRLLFFPFISANFIGYMPLIFSSLHAADTFTYIYVFLVFTSWLYLLFYILSCNHSVIGNINARILHFYIFSFISASMSVVELARRGRCVLLLDGSNN